MLARIAIPIGLFLLWCCVCSNWYVCHIKQVCDDGEKTEVPTEPTTQEPAPDTRPLVFNWSSADAKTQANFPAFRNSLVANLPEGQTLEIIGHYFEDEAKPENFQDMGFARANQIKELFKGLIPEELILLSSRVANPPEGAKDNLFEAASFGIIDTTKEQEVEIVESENKEEEVKEVTIHFPFNSAKKEADPKVDEYLDKLSKRLAQTEENVLIIGHTDNIGDDRSNKKLGRARANQIRNLLIKKGITNKRISIDSKGESEPIADNVSEAGRRRNRRVVLTIN